MVVNKKLLKKKDEIRNDLPLIVEDKVEVVPIVKTTRDKLGFWAVPLPKAGDKSQTDTKKYLGKK